jgi:carotenoid cleavage dioxygenase-like enzyme
MSRPYPDHPQLRGNFAPLRMECDAADLIIRGELPEALSVTYYRNGPDPQFPPRGGHHWFAGDGMLHMFRIDGGRVSYRNRWARTVKWRLEREAGRALFDPFNPMGSDSSVVGIQADGLANTNVVWHGGRLLALEEAHAPFEIDADTLESIGPWRFDGALEGPMTAHPKIDPVSGEMLFFGYMVDAPFGAGMSYQVVDAAGRLTRSERFEAPYPSMVHDFITTDRHVIFPIFPLTGSLQRAMAGGPPFAWEPDRPSCIGVMPRDGSVADIRWFETDPCYVFHPMNAYDDGNRIVAHVMQFEEAPLFPHADGSRADPAKANARLCEWVIDLGDNARGLRAATSTTSPASFPDSTNAEPGCRTAMDTTAPRRCRTAGSVSTPSSIRISPAIAVSSTSCRPATPPASRCSCRARRTRRRVTATCSASCIGAPRTAATWRCSTPAMSPTGRWPWPSYPTGCRSDFTATGATTPEVQRPGRRRQRHARARRCPIGVPGRSRQP